jgi:transposase InsO family protein
VGRLAQGNRSWGYDRIIAALANLSYTASDQTVGNILKRHGILPAPEQKMTTTWKDFIRTHMNVLVATDFFTAEVWTLRGLVTYYVLFFIHLGSRQVHVAGVTPHLNAQWMIQIARNVMMEEWSCLSPGQYLIHDRDEKYCPAFHQLIDAAGVARVPLPPRSPNLNAYAERCVRPVKEECLSRLILFGEASLRHALQKYVEHYHSERNHQGRRNMLLFPTVSPASEREGPMPCHERLGGLLKYYMREAA